MEDQEIKGIVKEAYGQIANRACSCCGSQKVAAEIGYTPEELAIAGEANLGLGCGNPLAMGKLQTGETVVDLGSGAGMDCFLAAKRVGPAGKVIGIDMSEEMVARARANADRHQAENVEFILAEIEKLPLESNSADVVISNCVINLAPDKDLVFKEAWRVLKTGGRLYLSDIVLLGELTEEQKNNPQLIAGCVAGALPKEDYLDKIAKAGFKATVLKENQGISKQQYSGLPLESISIEALKE